MTRLGPRQLPRRDLRCQAKGAGRDGHQRHREPSSAEPDQLADRFFQDGLYPVESETDGQQASLADVLGHMEGAAAQAQPAVSLTPSALPAQH